MKYAQSMSKMDLETSKSKKGHVNIHVHDLCINYT